MTDATPAAAPTAPAATGGGLESADIWGEERRGVLRIGCGLGQ